MEKCKKHPRYQAKRPPTSGCKDCLTVYRKRQAQHVILASVRDVMDRRRSVA